MEILKKLERRKQYESRFRALLFCVLTTMVILLFLSIGIIYNIDFYFIAEMALFGTISLPVLYFILKRSSTRKENGIAADLDRANFAKNRLESAVELKNSNNPVRNSQHKETIQFYNNIKINDFFLLTLLLLTLFITLLSLSSYLTVLSYKMSILKNFDSELHLKKIKRTVKNIEQKKPDFAEFKITAPESEIRAKPMDAIAWSAEGRSTNGFRDIVIRFYINGEFKNKIKVEVQSPEAKEKQIKKTISSESKEQPLCEITMNGEFYLDELEVAPFDVVSYYIEGYSNSAPEKGRKILSLPQFIEVRPFREEAQIITLNGISDPKKKKKMKQLLSLLEIINKLIRFQLTMNKALFTLKTSGLNVDNEIIQEELIGVTQDEYALKKELNSVLENIPADMISSNMMDYLRSAVSDMEKAETKLKLLINQKHIEELKFESPNNEQGDE
jgi:hypothetical protein